jgi:predicted permease
MTRALIAACRLLRESPGYSAAVFAVLTLGIGANAAVFSALDQVVLRPLPYPDSDRLASVWEDFSAFGTPRIRVSPATFFDWQRRARVWSSLAAYRLSGLTLTREGDPDALSGIAATSNLLPMLGVNPSFGRTFSGADDHPGSRVVVISDRLWRRRLASDPAVLGRTLRLNDEPYAIVGVMPPGFHFPDDRCDYWIPLGLTPELAGRRNSHFLYVVGRLAPGRTWNDARADMTGVAAQLAAAYPATNARTGAIVSRLKDDVLAGRDTALLVLFAASACVLLIACANAAILALVRGSRRRREVGVRMALGASRARVAEEMLLETLALAGAAAAAGTVLAHWSVAALDWVVPAGMRASAGLHVDGRTVTFAIAACMATTIVFGWAPVLVSTGEPIVASLSMAGARVLEHRGGRLRQALVAVEVALALVLLTSAGLLIQTLYKLATVDTGFRADHVLTASIEAPSPKYADPAIRRRFYAEILHAAASIPGVEAAGLTSDLPYTSRGNTMSIRVEHREQEWRLGRDALFRLVSPGYLSTIEARLQSGRLLADADSNDAPPVVVVNESFVREFFGGGDPIGQRLDTGTGTAGPLWLTIVGVVADVRERGADQRNRPAVYVPFTQTDIAFFQPSEIALRTSVAPLSIANELRRAVWSIDRDEPITRIRTLDDIVESDVADRRQVMTLVLAFAAVALLLAGIGLYSVLAYIVAQSTRDIGVRMAIGASPAAVVGELLRRAAMLTGGGVAAGLVCAAAATRALGSLLFEVSPLDARVLTACTAIVAAIALAASYVPARRAAATDPLSALRAD